MLVGKKQFNHLMNNSTEHTFHIPVMGVAYTIDTPLKVARFGINSVVSLVDDKLIEEMRKYYCNKEKEHYEHIREYDFDFRARRITLYLNLLDKLLKEQVVKLKSEKFENGSEIEKYFEMLPDTSSLKVYYNQMKEMDDADEKLHAQEFLRGKIAVGTIDVNIMTKCDKINYTKGGEQLGSEYTDALAALRGFANSQLNSSVVFSAGMNPRLYSYCELFNDFLPDEKGNLNKKIILKVSDYRSALIQGKFLAKKGLWVSEFRIESGLNCGGHVFPTEGYLLGPIMEEFKQKKGELAKELFELCTQTLLQKGKHTFSTMPELRISVQGGIGTAHENDLLLNYFKTNSTGWGSPFLMVPEATNVDDQTLQDLVTAKAEDFYLSNSSPLGVMFNNFRKASEDKERRRRINKGVPGSACYNHYLKFNTEFTDKPICTASRQYQNLKIKQLKEQNLSEEVLAQEIEKVTEKECICQGLGTAAFMKNGIPVPHNIKGVSICPGPNLAYFSNVLSLREMIDHIYGRKNVLNVQNRPNMFINELKIYVDYLKGEINKSMDEISQKKQKYLNTFKENILSGIEYYKTLSTAMVNETEQYRKRFQESLSNFERAVTNMQVPEPALVN